MMTLLRHAKEAATLCNRATPMVYDVFTVCENHGLTAEQLRKASKKRKRKQGPVIDVFLLVYDIESCYSRTSPIDKACFSSS